MSLEESKDLSAQDDRRRIDRRIIRRPAPGIPVIEDERLLGRRGCQIVDEVLAGS
jgi:hypothetical protein